MTKLTFSGIIPNAPVGRFEGVKRPTGAFGMMPEKVSVVMSVPLIQP